MENKPCVVLGVTGGIAAYKACELLRLLQKGGCNVYVVMTPNATKFVTPMTFQTLSGNPVAVDTFTHDSPWEVEHVELGKKADLFIVAPATANIIAKMANGIADDMLSTTLLATKAKVVVAPAMNTAMYTHPATQANIKILRDRGVTIIEPIHGHLACGDTGAGKLEEVSAIANTCLKMLNQKRDLLGLHVVVTAGPTREMLDPVRYITNRSSGKMGYALAKVCFERGADVTLLSGPVDLDVPEGIRLIPFISTGDLLECALKVVPSCDILIQAAAPADYRPETVATQKIKKKEQEDLHIRFIENPDVAQKLGQTKKPGQTFVGFAAETDHILEYAHSKLKKKNLDMIVANDVTKPGAGFDVDTNIVTLIEEEGIQELPLLSKTETAEKIIDHIITLRSHEKIKNV